VCVSPIKSSFQVWGTAKTFPSWPVMIPVTNGFWFTVGLNFVHHYVSRPTKITDKTVGRNQEQLHLVPRFSKVLGDASQGSYKVDAPMVQTCCAGWLIVVAMTTLRLYLHHQVTASMSIIKRSLRRSNASFRHVQINQSINQSTNQSRCM